jgi:hypothetical protein
MFHVLIQQEKDQGMYCVNTTKSLSCETTHGFVFSANQCRNTHRLPLSAWPTSATKLNINSIMIPTDRFKLIAFAKLIAFIIGWFLVLILAAAIKAPPQATASFMFVGIVGIPIGVIWLLLILVGVIKYKGE